MDYTASLQALISGILQYEMHVYQISLRSDPTTSLDKKGNLAWFPNQ